MRKRFLITTLVLSAAFIAFFIAEFLWEWDNAGRPGWETLTWAETNNAKLVDLLSPMARAYNNILAMLIATIGLAIPLTANMHTPKLIDMFLRDRTNQLMLGIGAFGAAHVLWVDYIIGPHFAPLWAVRLAVVGALISWAALIPYFFYVVRFLDPSSILTRLRDDIERDIDRCTEPGANCEAMQDAIHERLHQLGTLVLKSIDRADRGVALEGIWTFKRILGHYGAHKAQLPDAWFKVERKDFVGRSAEAIELLNEERNWFELMVMTQMFLAYQNALARTTDAIPAISDATRVVADQIAARGDRKALDLVTKFFNNYLREAIKRKDIHAIYDLFYQYRRLGADLSAFPELQLRIARCFRSYSEAAAAAGLPFVPQMAGFDLGWLVRRTQEAQSPVRADVLSEMLALDHGGGPRPLLGLLIKAKLILGAGLLDQGLPSEAARVAENVANVPAGALREATRELLERKERSYWEVTDRQVDFEWIAPERRPHLEQFVAQVLGQQPAQG